MMDAKRVRDIVSSPVMANVTYNGDPIYIDSISSDNTTAYVHPLNQPSKRQQVNLSSLIEQ